MEQGNIQVVRQLLPDVQELAAVIRQATGFATADEFWRGTLGRLAVASGGWEVWWSSYNSLKSPDGEDMFRLVVEAYYRGGPADGPLRRMKGMRLMNFYDASIPAGIANMPGKDGLAWLAGVVEKSFWEMRQKINEAEDKCVVEEAKAIQGMSPDGVDIQAGSYLAGQLNASQISDSQLQMQMQAGGQAGIGLQAANNKLTISQAEGIGGALGAYQYMANTGGFLSGVEQTILANWEEKMLGQQELARIKAGEVARIRYREMTGWPGDDPGEARRKEEKDAEAEKMRQYMEIVQQLQEKAVRSGIMGANPLAPNSPLRPVKPAAPAEPEPDLTKPAKRKILAIED